MPQRGEVLRIFDLIKNGSHGSLVESCQVRGFRESSIWMGALNLRCWCVQAKNCVLELEETEGLFNVDGEVVRALVNFNATSLFAAVAL
jgi:hypothetical protein